MSELTYEAWFSDFCKYLLDAGMPVRQVDRYLSVYESDAKKYFADGIPADRAATCELMGVSA